MKSDCDDDWHCYSNGEDNIAKRRVNQVPQAILLEPLEVDQAAENDDDI